MWLPPHHSCRALQAFIRPLATVLDPLILESWEWMVVVLPVVWARGYSIITYVSKKTNCLTCKYSRCNSLEKASKETGIWIN